MEMVFAPNVVDGCIPSELGTGTTAELEEERRLLYVAMTRAKDDLHLIVPQRFLRTARARKGTGTFMLHGRVYSGRVVELFSTRRLAGTATGSASVRDLGQGVRVDVGLRMRGMWR